ncbi:MAG: hypothetical protein Q4P13_10450 [Psychrobacter sp.]|nr:hypothetical protein [Psychrobacter sp.]
MNHWLEKMSSTVLRSANIDALTLKDVVNAVVVEELKTGLIEPRVWSGARGNLEMVSVVRGKGATLHHSETDWFIVNPLRA